MFDPRTPARRFVTLGALCTVAEWLLIAGLVFAFLWFIKHGHA